jgi:hypothetical protein
LNTIDFTLKLCAVLAIALLALSIGRIVYRFFNEQSSTSLPSFDRRDWRIAGILTLVTFVGYLLSYIILLELHDLPWSMESLQSILRRWDVPNYESIAMHGYLAEGERRIAIAFLPLYPAISRAFSALFFCSLGTAMILVNLILGSLLTGSFYRLARMDFAPKAALFATGVMWAWPGSFYRLVPYSETLFTLLVTLLFIAARKRFWVAVAGLALCAALTRTHGYVLFAFVCVEIWSIRQLEPLDQRGCAKILSLLAVPLAVGIYLAINYATFGNPLQFTVFQKEIWYREVVPFWDGLWNLFVFYPFTNWPDLLTRNWSEIFAMSIMILGATLGSWKLRSSYAVFLVGSVFFFASNSFQCSNVRFASTMIPLFFLAARNPASSAPWRFVPIVGGAVGFCVYLFWWSKGGWVAG